MQCGNHFTMYFRDVLMLYTLNVCRAVWQAQLSKLENSARENERGELKAVYTSPRHK